MFTSLLSLINISSLIQEGQISVHTVPRQANVPVAVQSKPIMQPTLVSYPFLLILLDYVGVQVLKHRRTISLQCFAYLQLCEWLPFSMLHLFLLTPSLFPE